MTCKENCLHYPVCKETVADENWTDEAPEELRKLFTPKHCENFLPQISYGTWEYYSTTMMECSKCTRHVPRHKYMFCPHCGAIMINKPKKKTETDVDFEQLTLFDISKEGFANE